jgi:hypothetical protein
MEASDMLDVLHYFLEEDFRYSSEYEPIYKDNFRKNIYESMYGTSYKYVSSETPKSELNDIESLDGPEEFFEPGELIEPFNPRQASVKPYIAPTPILETEELPFGSILDQPLG